MGKIKDKAALVKWDNYRKNLKRSTPVDLSEDAAAKKKRIDLLLSDFFEFAKYYFPDSCKSEFAPFHRRFVKKVLQKKQLFIARKWARAHAKSEICFMLCIYLMMKGELKNAIYVSKTQDAAIDLIRPIKIHLESNQRLINDFGVQKGLGTWESAKIITANGISIRALGTGQSPRGTKNEEARPDHIFFDDADDDELCRNARRLDHAYDWTMGALYACFDIVEDATKRFIAVNNVIAKDCLIKRLSKVADDEEQIDILTKTKEKDVDQIKQLRKKLKGLTDPKEIEVYKMAIGYLDSGMEPSWKSRFSMLGVCYMLCKVAYRLAQREYFNNPFAEGKIFKKHHLVFGKIPSINKMIFKIAYLDPGFKKTSTSDSKSWGLVGLHEGKYYIIKVFCGQASISEMIEWGYELDAFLKRNNASATFYMEEVFLQDMLYKDFTAVAEKRKYSLPLKGDTRKKPDKDSRIEATSGHFERGNVIFNEDEKDNHHMNELMEQYLNFEPGVKTKKDGPDMVEGAMHLLQQAVMNNTSNITIGPRGHNKYKF